MSRNDQQDGFDDITIDNNKNNNNEDQQSGKKKDSQGNGLQGVIRVLSILPCFPKYEPKPDTPNIDKVEF